MEGDERPTGDMAGSRSSAATTKPTLRISGIPDENPTGLQRKYKPMVDYLSKALGAQIKYIPVTDYGAAVQALIAGHLDFVWLGGFTHVQARNMTEVVPLVMRDIDRQFQSVFIANIASGIESVDEIKARKMAFGSKSSTSGRLMPSYFLLTHFNIDPAKDLDGEPVFSGAHDATVKLVESGRVDAGALNKEVWDRLIAEGKVDEAKVKVIWTTPGYVDYVWTARKTVPVELRDKFADALLSLDVHNSEHKAVLDLQGASKFVPAQSSDFDQIEEVARKLELLKE
jgi:phosphonate transport system substrate-binding protein